nr:alkaline phosphatase [Anaerobacillus isosaccharinicus]QOY38460.1 alkaline phosphatase [Anaerobacillus isosaccharinicus]
MVLSLFAPFASAAEKGSAKNVILLIPDGLGASYMTATRIYKGEELSFERYVKGLMNTWSSNTNVTDSAAAGTAMATGYKADNGKISVTPDGMEPDSILDAARDKGKATGVVATSRVTHATPAVFVAHDSSRGNEVALAQQYINNVDVILGGGQDMFTLEAEGGKQPERNLVQEAIDAGYNYITTKSEMADTSNGKVLGLFAKAAMTYEIDRVDVEQPSLSEMTKYAIDVLSKDQDGFFLMVEGSQIDWAGHANDPVAAIHDTLEFEEAVNEALEFAKKDKETLVVIAGDHETGGLVIGSNVGGYADNIEILKNVKASNIAILETLADNVTIISLANAQEIDGTHYIHIRDAAAQLQADLDYNPSTKLVTINKDDQTVIFDLKKKEVNKKAFDMFLNDSKTKQYINVNDFFELFGYDVAIGTTKDKPELTTAYLAHINNTVSPILGFDLTEEDITTLTSVNWNGRYDLSNTLGKVVSNHAYLSWGTNNHSGVEVPVYAYGVGADQFVGLIDNTELPRIISYLMGTELFDDQDETIKRLEERRTN